MKTTNVNSWDWSASSAGVTVSSSRRCPNNQHALTERRHRQTDDCILERELPAHDEASVSPDDRGFLFADGVYEVLYSYDGMLLREDRTGDG